MSTRVAAWLAWSLCLLCVALAVAGLILALLNGLTLGEIFLAWAGSPVATLLAQIVSFSVVGALIASHRPENSIGWLSWPPPSSMGSRFLERSTPSMRPHESRLSPLGSGVSLADGVDSAPGYGIILVFLPLLFPDGHLPSRRWRGVGWLGGLSMADLRPDLHRTLARTGPAPCSSEARGRGRSMALCGVGLGAETRGPDAAGGRARRRDFAGGPLPPGEGGRRQQIKWFASAAALTLVWILLFGQASLRGLPGVIVALSGLLVIASIPVATGIAILRYRLYDIDRIINRTLVYGSLSASMALVYFGGVATTQAIFRALTGQEQQPQLAVVVSTLAIAALFMPLRRRIQPFIDSRFYRRKYDAAKTLEAFSAKLRDETDLHALSNDLVGVVRETMQPAHVSLWLRPEVSPKGTQAGS